MGEVTACNVLAHVPDPHDFVQGIYLSLAARREQDAEKLRAVMS